MQGLDHNTDWLRLTWAKRQLKGVGPYHIHGQVWQYMLDWATLNFSRTYIQLARGHDKTARGAWWMLLWLLSTNHGQGFACGVDRDNARLFRDAAKWQTLNHGSLFSAIKVHNYDVVNTRTHSRIRILASDEASNYGLTPDLLIINDFHAWQNQGFFDALFTAMGKRKGNRIWIESNALALGTPQIQWIRPIRTLAKESYQSSLDKGELDFTPKINGSFRTNLVRRRVSVGDRSANDNTEQVQYSDPIWYYYAPRGFLATWQMHMFEDWKKVLLPQTYKRLILNEDTTEGDQFLTEEQVTQCEINHPILFKDIKHNRPIIKVCVDFGYTQDAAVIAVLAGYVPYKKKDVGVEDSGGRRVMVNELQIDLLHLDVFTGSRDNPVQSRKIKREAERYADNYRGTIHTDPWEMRWILSESPRWNEFKFTAQSVRQLTTQLYQVFVKKQIRIQKAAGTTYQQKSGSRPEEWSLKRELTEAVLKEMSYGIRVDHQNSGFTDRLMAIGMGVVLLVEDFPPSRARPAPDEYSEPGEHNRMKWASIIKTLGKPEPKQQLVIA